MDSISGATEMKKALTKFNEESERVYKTVIPYTVKKLTELWEEFEGRGLFKLSYSSQFRQGDQTQTRMCDKANGVPETIIKVWPPAESDDKMEGTETSDTVAKESPSKQTKLEMRKEAETKAQSKDLNEAVSSTPQTEKAGNDDSLTCSSAVREMMAALKPFLAEALINTNCISRWIATTYTPQMANDHAFTEGYRKTVLDKVNDLESASAIELQSITSFNKARAKLVTKIMKYPTVMDYRMALKNDDETEIINVSSSILMLRNLYAELYDCLSKNMDQLENMASVCTNSLTS
ncbi:hypothetical protein ACOMHN_009803 [Nucella lapillus]